MQRRAKKGGEVGANGEFYEGGKFINTVPQNAKRYGSAPKGPAKKEPVAPYLWEERPEGKRSIYYAIVGIHGYYQNGLLMVDENKEKLQNTLNYMGRTKEQVEAWVERYNNGERWIDQKELYP